ncbi:hypothetical protein [Inconstantimicrobium mannanitabidum]|uniref:Uncharacterized protein n=1 Tax=Inconstantimicrobium mannanitabidum TaxID=1604901 RepID=A0ACB5RAJ4_9CLOT|nr:hypothetical protein [Clostridium sp. TW13]GKX66013.1 hypothetical protein rsdtw13_12710 [Clostridium sp. TW13]
MNGGETLRYIRITLGLKQKDIRDQGLRDISGIENGVVQMSSKIAIALEKKLNEVIKEKHLDGILDFEVNSLVFKKGLDIDLEECFKQMSKDYKIDEFLELTQNKYEFSNVKRAIEILAKDYGNNINSISILSYLIIENSKDDNCLIYAYLQLQRVAYYKTDWNGIITYYDVIKDKVGSCQELELKDDIYINVATAYCMVAEFEKAKDIVSRVRYIIRYRNYIDNILSNINLELGNNDESIKYNQKILNYTENNNEELTCKANICYIASLKKDINLFIESFNEIDINKDYYDFARQQFFNLIIKACDLLNILDDCILTKIFKITKLIKYKNIEENINYFKKNGKLISQIIINNSISIDAELFVFISKNINMGLDNKNILMSLCNI